MIGQDNNKTLISRWKNNNSFPRFMIITGPKGSGKFTMANYISQHIKGYKVECNNKVDDVRQVINNSYKVASTTTYIFRDMDTMSQQAKNALLKVTEEPPKRAYFIMTAKDMEYTLPTLKSRGTEIKMEPYTTNHLKEITEDVELINVSNNPGQIKQLLEMDYTKFLNFCYTVLDSIGKVTGVNAFKIGLRFKFKETEEGYDPILFLDVLTNLCKYRISEQIKEQTDVDKRYLKTMLCCMEHGQDLNKPGIKKDSTFDMFILDLKNIWS